MMIARTTTETAEFILLGLSRENIDRLLNGKPIRLRRETHGEGVPEGWTIGIMFGETEMEMKRALEDAGVLGPETKIKVDPRLT